MSDFLTESDKAIEVLRDCIWTIVMKVMEEAGKPNADGLEITMHLVGTLPTIPLQLAFHSTPGLSRFTPEVYATRPKSRTDILDFSHAPSLQSDRKVLDVLHEEIVKNVCGTTEKENAVQPTWLMSMANVSTTGVKAAEVGAGDGPTSSHMCLILLSDIVRPGLHLRVIIHKVPDPAHLPQAPVPGQGVCQTPAAQTHQNWALATSLMLDLQRALTLDSKCLQKAAVPVGQNALTPHHLM